MGIYIIWVLLSLFYGIGTVYMWLKKQPDSSLEIFSMCVSHFAYIWLCLSLAIFTLVFIINPGCNVAQGAAGSEKGMAMWSLWFHWWGWLVIGILISSLLSFLAIALPPYPKKNPIAFGIKIIGLCICVAGGFLLLPLFPDA